MRYINTSAHEKFMSQCNNFIDNARDNDLTTFEKAGQIKADLERLQQIVKMYMQTISSLPGFSDEYNSLERQVRAKINKLKVKKKVAKVQVG